MPYLHGTYYAPFILLILIVFHEDGGVVSRFLSCPSVQFFGGLSLYFYLIHFKVLLRVSASGIPRISYIILTAFGISLVFSLLLYVLLHFNKTMQQLKTSKLQPIIEKLTLFLSIILEAGCISMLPKNLYRTSRCCCGPFCCRNLDGGPVPFACFSSIKI